MNELDIAEKTSKLKATAGEYQCQAVQEQLPTAQAKLIVTTTRVLEVCFLFHQFGYNCCRFLGV